MADQMEDGSSDGKQLCGNHGNKIQPYLDCNGLPVNSVKEQTMQTSSPAANGVARDDRYPAQMSAPVENGAMSTGNQAQMYATNQVHGDLKTVYGGNGVVEDQAYGMWQAGQAGAQQYPYHQNGYQAESPWQQGASYPMDQQGATSSQDYVRHTNGFAQLPIKQEPEAKMSLWDKTKQLSPESLKLVENVYGNHFPLEIRHIFAGWIEEQSWKEVDQNNPSHIQYAVQLLNQLLQLIETRAEEDVGFLTRLNLRNTAKNFRDWYSDNPMNLVHTVKSCLATEEALVFKETANPGTMEQQSLINNQCIIEEIKSAVDMLEAQTNSTDQDLRRMQMDQEKFIIDYQKQLKIANNLQQLKQVQHDRNYVEAENRLKAEKEELDKQLISSAQLLLQQRIELASKHKDTLTKLENLQKKVVDDELIKWKRSQQLAGNGEQFDHTQIDTIQSWCESLATLIWNNRRQIMQVDMQRQQLPINIPQGVADIQPELTKVVTGLLSSLVTSTFIVEHQPPQVLKKDARFTATVRLLVGGKLNLHMTPPKVKATIISEQQARALLQNEEGRRSQKCGDILNNEAQMDYHQHSGQLSICFRNMSLKNIKRADRRGADIHCVAEEKFCILFASEFNVGGNELNFQVWTLSLPVVVTVHGNQECQATATYLWDNQFSEATTSLPVIVTVHTQQECQATATVLWDNHFSEMGRTPFQVPDTVPWGEFSKMLSTKFQSMTGRGLSDQNLQFLAHKLLGYNGSQDLNSMTVSWVQFNKENLTGRQFTFWEWFWAVGKLVKEHLRGPWNDGYIHGFIEKMDTQNLLMSRPNGTFLLRFSDGTLGGVTIAWVAEHKIAGERQVWNLHPFTIKDFSIRGLADRVKDLQSLITLYPDIPKNVAFQKYYSPVPEVTQPGAYVGTSLMVVINDQTAAMNIEEPHTPQAYNDPFSPPSSIPPVSRVDGLDDSMLQGDYLDMAVASPEDLDFKQLNELLQNHSG